MRIDRVADRRLDGLVSAIRAELLAAGFKVTPESGGTVPASAIITLRVEGARAMVVAAADGATWSFSADVALADAGAAARDANRVALQVAEWLAAIWLPPPPRAPASADTAADPGPAAPSPEPAPAGPAALEPLALPPFAPPAIAPAATAAVRRAPAPPAARSIALLDAGVGVLYARHFGPQFGFEIGAALHGSSPILGGATPFARLALGLFWLGSGVGGTSSSERFDLNFATVTGAAGLRVPLGETLSVDTSAGVGLALISFAGDAALVDAGTLATRRFSGERLAATPGGAVALVNRFSQRWALAAELRASWMVPGLVFVTAASQVGSSSWPMITGTVGLRIIL
ncbi:MAG TPA: hypothetical protein VIF57_15515 [Polyangia bacterium]